MRMAIGLHLTAWLGATFLLDGMRWLRRPTLAARVLPYLATRVDSSSTRSAPATSVGELLRPVATLLGASLARLFGVREDATRRLARVGSLVGIEEHRTRQVGMAMVAAIAAGALTIATQPPAVLGVGLLVGGPLLAFLVVEQQLASASERWQARVLLELPVVTEQLGMLLDAGYSLGAALNRLAERTHGAVHHDLARVGGRLQQGLTEIEALREWADRADVIEVTRLVSVLALNREAGDLGRLIAAEAHATRLGVHRQQIELLERRAQQVWVPVTVATLVPGVLFLAVPFMDALRLFAHP